MIAVLILICSLVTSKYTYNCTINDDKFSKEFELLNDHIDNFDNFDNFELIKPNPKKCEYVDIGLSFGTYQTVYNFTCPQKICFMWCNYVNECKYSIYSEKNQTCTRATDAVLSDNYQKSKDFIKNKVIVYKRKSGTSMRYYDQYCNNYFSKKSCNRDKQCKWRRGKAGYNRETFVLGPNWCGRVKCKKT